MAQFNPQDYETVAERITRFYGDHPHGRILTDNLTTSIDRQVSTWVVKAEIWLPMFEIWEDAPAQETPNNSWYLKATGLAFEVDGTGMANKTSALENAETSAIGRALANAGYSGDKRTSREEMQKVARGVTPPPAPSVALTDERKAKLLAEITAAKTKDALRYLWKENADILDVEWQNSLGEMVSFKGIITSRQAEVKL